MKSAQSAGSRSLLLAAALLIMAAPLSAQEDADCLNCHGDRELLSEIGASERMFVDVEAIKSSVHGYEEHACVYCHQELAGVERFPHKKELAPVSCGGACHGEEAEVYEKSLHGYALERGNERAPRCTNCHGGHSILRSSDPRSTTHHLKLPDTCADCHGKAGLLTDQIVKLPESFRDYTESVHGQANLRGIGKAASCADCHEVHELRSSADPDSPIHPHNQSATCGKCHPDMQRLYDMSIHGRAVKAGVPDSPTCTDCHGEHLILSPRDPSAATHANRIADETCGKCHNDPIIIAKYSLREGVVDSYTDSYHGWATRRSDHRAATCVSCHTAHEILPASEPASAISQENVVATCAQCHDRATPEFALSYSHETASIEANPINRTIRVVYIVMIALVIGGMVLHNLLIMNYFMVERRRKQAASKWVLRFDRSQILQHLFLTVAFVMLVVTGFALRFPEAGWVRFLTAIGMSEEVRANLHRFFAIMLIAVAVTHIWYVFLTRRGRQEILAMAPRPADVHEALGAMKFFTWRSRKKVKFGRYDYSQKAEYWALIWGTILMIATGFVLWFPEIAVGIFPYWIVSASQTVHYYEAWLATLAIIVWHFFFVIFHPEEYPMSWTWLTGRMSEESVKKHHARWYEEEIAPNAGGDAPKDSKEKDSGGDGA